MSPIGDHFGSWNGAAAGRAARRLALQKPKATSGLASDSGDETSPGGDHAQQGGRENLHRSGTISAVPFRHALDAEAPRLTSAFVAQLLGQILPDPEQAKLPAGTLYEADESRSTLLLDTRL